MSSSSIALVGPISRGRVHDEPVSHESATPVNAVLKPAVSAARRRSQAIAIDSPAPAATPLTAAITGLGIVAMRQGDRASSGRRPWPRPPRRGLVAIVLDVLAQVLADAEGAAASR